jgi:hypothetical protein
MAMLRRPSDRQLYAVAAVPVAYDPARDHFTTEVTLRKQ